MTQVSSTFCLFEYDTFVLKEQKWGLQNYQYPFDEHVVVLLNELRSTQHKATKKLYRCFSYTRGVIHEATVHSALHVQLENKYKS